MILICQFYAPLTGYDTCTVCHYFICKCDLFFTIFLTVTWNQFDGLAYVYGNQGLFSRVKDYFSRDKTVEYRTSRALACFLPKWKGFVINEPTEQMNATEALVKLQNVVECLSNVWTEENGYKKPNKVDVRKVSFCSCGQFLRAKNGSGCATAFVCTYINVLR